MEHTNPNTIVDTASAPASEPSGEVVDFCMKRTVSRLMENSQKAFEAAAELRALSSKLDRLERGVATTERIMWDFVGALGEERHKLGESLDLHHNCMRAIDSGSPVDMTEMARAVKLVIEH